MSVSYFEEKVPTRYTDSEVFENIRKMDGFSYQQDLEGQEDDIDGFPLAFIEGLNLEDEEDL